MSLVAQVLTTLGWIVIALVISPMIWLIFQPYFKGLLRAERRAADLLRAVLTPEQIRQLAWSGYLEIQSSTEPQRVYRVPLAKGYVQVVENGRTVMRLCVQPVEYLPDADVVALHKLMIEADEENYLLRANKYLCVD
jgi:hypothetical protein